MNIIAQKYIFDKGVIDTNDKISMIGDILFNTYINLFWAKFNDRFISVKQK